MRDIIFRGKRADNGEWVEGSLIIVEDAHRIATSCLQGDDENLLDTVCAYKVIPETVGQYTGLTDQNGTDIFEGDIIRNYDFTEEDGYAVVKYDGGAFELNSGDISATFHENYWPYECEVVGNIYDNPDLLGEKQ